MRPPVFGALTHKIALARFTATLSSLLSSGVPIIERSTSWLRPPATNHRQGRAGGAGGVRQGRPSPRRWRSTTSCRAWSRKMIETGEESRSALDAMLEKVAEFYDQRSPTRTTESLTSVLEPLLIVTMGVCIGAIVIAMYLPMFDIYKVIQNKGSSA